jgi:hypothetical protein
VGLVAVPLTTFLLAGRAASSLITSRRDGTADPAPNIQYFFVAPCDLRDALLAAPSSHSRPARRQKTRRRAIDQDPHG